MKNKQKGSFVLIVAVVVALAVAVGIYSYSKNVAAPTLSTISPAHPITPSQPTEPTQPAPPNNQPMIPANPPTTPAGATPAIQSISPASGATGDTVTLTGSGFLDTNTVLFGGGPVNNAVATKNGSLLTFTVPNAVGADCKPNEACPMYARLITDGNYSVSVRNANGTSNSVSFTVTGSTAPITPQ